MAIAGGNPVLKALDKAHTQAYHFKAIVIAGMGFLTDSYDLFVIAILSKLLGRIYYPDNSSNPKPGTLPAGVNAAVLAMALCGTLVGQLFFGWAGDKWGRKKVYGITLALMIVASLGQGLSFGHTRNSVIITLCFFRFWLGFGIGGDYPLSATIMSEYSNTRTRGAFVAAVFAMQGTGILVAATVSLVVVAIFNNTYPRTPFEHLSPSEQFSNDSNIKADWVWRIILMFGAIPAALTYYSRSKMPETARYTALVERDQQQATLDMARVLDTTFDTSDTKAEAGVAPRARRQAIVQYGLLSRKFFRRHGLELFGACLTWFLLDISYYSQNLLQTQIFSAVGWVPPAPQMSALEETYKNARAQAIIALLGTVPGYWVTVAFIDSVGRRRIQITGFAMMSVFMYILSFDFYRLRGELDSNGVPTGGNHIFFVFFYAMTFFFSNFGPNSTTFIIPAELFPARLRSTCHGIASASGKAGSIVGTFGFLYASHDSHLSNIKDHYPTGIGYKYSFMILAIVSTIGGVVTVFCTPETKGRSLEDLSGENGESDELAVANETDDAAGNGNKHLNYTEML